VCTTHVVLDDFGRLGRAYREIDKRELALQVTMSVGAASMMASRYTYCPSRCSIRAT
jgi:hypothetical protein